MVNSENTVGGKINLETLKYKMRVINIQETFSLICRNKIVYWSWGSNNPTNYFDQFLRITVNGHKHQGYVYICVDGVDLYNVYLTDVDGTIKEIINGIYFDQLVGVIDSKIERN